MSFRLFIDGLIFARQQWGGISRVWEAYLRRLPQHVERPRLLVPFRYRNPLLSNLLEEQGDKYRVSTDFFYWPVRYFERISVRKRILRSFYVDNSVDVFHSTFYSTVGGKKIKRVVTVHDMIPELFREQFRGKWQDLERSKKRRTLDRADKIISVSRHTKEDLLRLYPGIPEEKVEVIHHGLFPAGSGRGLSLEQVVQRLAPGYDRPVERGNYYLYVGNRGNYKNFQLLIRLVENNPHYRDALFLCIGGEDPSEVKQQLEDKKIKNFLFAGYAGDDELAVLYRNAAALVFPSRYEGFGLPVLEAMVHDCPVVCSDVSSLPEVGGDAAIYFNPGSIDSLHEALEKLSRGSREALLQKGKTNTQRFCWDRSTQRLVEIYKSII